MSAIIRIVAEVTKFDDAGNQIAIVRLFSGGELVKIGSLAELQDLLDFITKHPGWNQLTAKSAQ